jgi:hypothetical protein
LFGFRQRAKHQDFFYPAPADVHHLRDDHAGSGRERHDGYVEWNSKRDDDG